MASKGRAAAVKERGEDPFHGMTVGEALHPQDACRLLPGDTLGDLAETLATTGRTAAAVLEDEGGGLVGLVTENDVLRAYYEGAPPGAHLGEWLDSGAARAPGSQLKRLSVRPSALLAEVAEHMVENAMAGDFACHHATVKQEDGKFCGVLDAQDLVKALCCPEVLEGQHPLHAAEHHEMGDLTVRDVMKPRDLVFTCAPDSTMKDVLRMLLLTQQNSTLVSDERGIYGIVTPRDAVRAFADGVANSVGIAEWLEERPAGTPSRTVACDAKLSEAAASMAAGGLHHVVAVMPGTSEAVGVLSSLDIVLRSRRGAAAQRLRAPPRKAGPKVGDILAQHPHLAAICKRGAKLGEAAETFRATGRTSAVLLLGSEGMPPLGLVTENDILRAYLGGWPRDAPLEGWLKFAESNRTKLPPHLLVPVSMRLLDAASLMLTAASPQRTCHHLVVKGHSGGWLGVFSALDVARALWQMCSELDTLKAGAEKTAVSSVMKPRADVPTVRATDSLYDALTKLNVFCQNAALVVHDSGTTCGLVTTRCAIEAASESVDHELSVADWLGSREVPDGPREVAPDCRLSDAAAIMATHSLHHLVVVEPATREAVGVLSSLDLARGVASISVHAPFVSLGWLKSCKGPAACRWQVVQAGA